MKRHFALPALLLCSAALAQAPAANPTSRQMIDALKPRTRSLVVEAVREPAGGQAPAATSAAAHSAASAAAPAPASTPGSAQQAGAISLAIQFDLNSDRVQPASLQTLAELAAAMKSPELSKLRFRLEGHTDGTGQAAYNRKLSAMRADAVKRVLVINDVTPDRLITEGKGSSELANPANPGAAENRRVRIVSLEP